tara:strand:- start:710 stop:1489 length:780 start_codon:yes stop_codon:yes gene_type:complete
MVKKAVIPCAGWGTRMYPFSKTLPKELIPIVNKPVLHYVIDECIENGIEEFIIIVTPEKTSIFQKYFNTHYPNIKVKYVIQNQMTGWVDAMYICESEIENQPFVLILPDNLFVDKGSFLKKLIETHNKYQKSVMGVSQVPMQDATKYGVIKNEPLEDNMYKMLEFLEKPDVVPSNLVHNGWDIFTPVFFEAVREVGKGMHENKKADLTFNKIIEKEGMYACEYTGTWLDTGNPKSYVKSFWRLLDDFESLKGIKEELGR